MSKIEKAFYQVYICLILTLFVWVSASFIRFPYGVDYGEAPMMDQVKKIQSGTSLYKAEINEPPYVISNYPPLYPLVVAFINFIVKIPLFQTGRIVSLFFSIVSGSIIGLISLRLIGNKLLCGVAAVLFLGHPYVMVWSSLARVDLMALAFSLLGLWILYQRGNTRFWIGLACLCFLISAFTRQTYILAGPLAGFVWLWQHNHRRALAFALFFICSGLLIFGILNTITMGGFYTNIVVANINQYQISRLWITTKHLISIWPLVLLVSIIVVLFMIRNQIQMKKNQQSVIDQHSSIYTSLFFYSLGSIFSMLLIGKVGSSFNYFLELIVVCAIWCVVALKYITEQKTVLKKIFFGLLFIQLIWGLTYSYRLNNFIIGTRLHSISLYDDLFQKVFSATQRGVVLSDDYLDMVVLADQPIYYQPFEYVQLYKKGLWDISGLVSDITEHKFSLILVGGDTYDKEDFWPTPIIEIIKNDYSIEIATDLLLLTPKEFH